MSIEKLRTDCVFPLFWAPLDLQAPLDLRALLDLQAPICYRSAIAANPACRVWNSNCRVANPTRRIGFHTAQRRPRVPRR